MAGSRKSVINHKVDLLATAFDMGTITAIFTLFTYELLDRFLEETGRFFLFPMAATLSVLRAILAWRQAQLDGGKRGTLVKAVVETVGAIAITTAVVGGFVAASVFATVAPIIFTATLGAKALFHAGASIYYLAKSLRTQNPDKKTEYRASMKSHAVGAVALSLASAAVGLVLLAAKPLLGFMGVVGGLIGITYATYKAFTIVTPPAPEQINEPHNDYMDTAGIHHQLGTSPTNTLTEKIQNERTNGYGATGTRRRKLAVTIEKDDLLNSTIEPSDKPSLSPRSR